MKTSKLEKSYRIVNGKHFRLKDYDPADTGPFHSEGDAQHQLQRDIVRLRELAEMLYAEDRWSLLLILQGMDAAGKDGTVKHVMSGLNPQACQVHPFKEPSSDELQHDFLWRAAVNLPERGHIGIFNRSYYEEVLVVRVHSKILDAEKLPQELITKQIWQERFEDILSLERHLARNGTVIRKFFLHLSKKEQKKRFLDRLNEPGKHWKFSAADIRERKYWDDYQDAYEEMIQATTTKYAPWYVIPADHKWFTHLAVAAALVETLEELKLSYPKVDEAERKELAAAREELESKNHD